MTNTAFEILPWALLILGATSALGLALVRFLRSASDRSAGETLRFVLWTLLLGVSSVFFGLSLFPPDQSSDGQWLIVGTARASAATAPGLRGAARVDLPESDEGTSASRVPDLATGLRRFPGTSRILVVGAGLPPRDLDAAGSLRVDFKAAPAPAGLIELNAPASVVAGALWRVTGRVMARPGTRVILLDPAGQAVARARPDAGGTFALSTVPPAAGTALYRLRLTDAAGARTGADEVLPVRVEVGEKIRVVLLAGAPSPELKYLRRWASDAGLDLRADIAVGARSRIGELPSAEPWIQAPDAVPVDLVVLDDRRWRALGAQETSLLRSVRNGAGLLLRMTGPFAEQDRDRLQRLGFKLAPVMPASATGEGSAMRPSGRLQGLRPAASGARPIHDPLDGNEKGMQRTLGQGRVGIWWGEDSYPRVLAGRSTSHGLLWGLLFQELARASTLAVAPTWQPGPVRVRERQSICAESTAVPRVIAPGDRVSRLVAVAGAVHAKARSRRCAAFWPREQGWHRLRWGTSDTLFFVHGAFARPGIAEMRDRQATLRLATRATTFNENPAQTELRAGSRWPWLLAWLLSAAAMWWLERRRRRETKPDQGIG